MPAAFATLAVHPRVVTTVRAREEECILRSVFVWVHRSNDGRMEGVRESGTGKHWQDFDYIKGRSTKGKKVKC